MLVLSPFKNEREIEMENFSMEGNEFSDFSSRNSLDAVDFDILFDGYLPEDWEILAEFEKENDSGKEERALSVSASASELGSGLSNSSLIQGEETVSKRLESIAVNRSLKQGDKGRKSSSHSKNHPGKRKGKVDWTPDMHRRFVQVVEQLGVDKAVPSRIRELMGIDFLTRHNIASHLQKYRSHQKHLVPEAVSWSKMQRVGNKPVTPLISPTVGFRPVAPMPHFRPLHVWGHPFVDTSFNHTWHKPHAWTHPAPMTPHGDTSIGHTHRRHHVPTPCFPPHLPSESLRTLPVTAGQTLLRPPSGIHPSTESIDAAIGDVLSKPWLPLPLGLKPPSIDTVMTELQSQGISKIPPTCA